MSRGCRVVDSHRQGGTAFQHPKRRSYLLDAQIELDIDPDDKVSFAIYFERATSLPMGLSDISRWRIGCELT